MLQFIGNKLDVVGRARLEWLLLNIHEEIQVKDDMVSLEVHTSSENFVRDHESTKTDETS